MIDHRLCRALAIVVAACALGACATPPIKHKDPRDPWERMNRATDRFNDKLVRHVAMPVGYAYRRVTPGFVRTGISNFFSNLQTPDIIANDLLQAKFKTSISDTGRLLMNTVVGVGGLLDPATPAGLAKHDNDFGRTLGTWGLHPGPYLVIPLLGPADLRDGIGRVADGYASPLNYVNNTTVHYGLYGLDVLDIDSTTLIPAYELIDSQHPFDQYSFMRNAYLQRREFLIHGTSPDTEKDLEKELEESAPDDSGNTGGAGQKPASK